jgi:hypothetical protein
MQLALMAFRSMTLGCLEFSDGECCFPLRGSF